MNQKQQLTALLRLSEQIGGFIEYWGFKKIHGMIWTHLYLSPEPLSAQDLIQRLRVSKALISLSIKDLLEYRLILQTEESLERKNKFYFANPDVFEVIRDVLERRELVMMNRIISDYQALKLIPNTSDPQGTPLPLLDPTRIKELGEMIDGAHENLKSLIQLSKMDPSFFKNFTTQGINHEA